MQHSFDVSVATELGIPEAILLNNLWFWIKRNEANEQGFHDGRYWTYNTVKAFLTLFPYLTEKQIRTALNHLKKQGMILTGNYNENKYDRTLWYTLTDKGISLLSHKTSEAPKIPNFPNGKMEVPEKENGSSQKGTSNFPNGKMEVPEKENLHYTDINTNINTDIKPYGKISYAEFVWLTEIEYEALQKKLGSKEAVDQCITILDNYKGSNGKSYASDYRAILSWVIDRYKERQKKDNTNTENRNANNNVAGTTLEVLARMRAKKEGRQYGNLQQ